MLQQYLQCTCGFIHDVRNTNRYSFGEMLQWFIRAHADYLVIIRITTGHFWRHFYEHINLAMTLRNANRVIGEKEPKGNHATWKSRCALPEATGTSGTRPWRIASRAMGRDSAGQKCTTTPLCHRLRRRRALACLTPASTVDAGNILP
jgi:hypothetical protein